MHSMAETLSSLRVTVFRLVVSRRSVAGRSYRRRSFWSPRRICPRSTPSGSGPTSMRTLIRIRHRVPRHQRGVLDTSVVIDLASIDANALPAVASITALTLAELTTGPLSSADTSEQARRLGAATMGREHLRTDSIRRSCRSCVRPNLRRCSCFRAKAARAPRGRSSHCGDGALAAASPLHAECSGL